MIIHRMRASFGCLEGAELELHEGLNILEAANESGKSTWCAFLRCMLYGLDSSRRARGGVKPEKLRYAPWSGARMEGELELSFRGERLTLRRSTENPALPLRAFSAVYTRNGAPADFLTGADAGETLVGVGESVFERTAFLRQTALGVGGSAELERRVGALLTAGDEESSFAEARERLTTWQHRRRFHTRGTLPELEAEREQLRARLQGIAEGTAALCAREEDIAARASALEAERAQRRLRQSAQQEKTLQEWTARQKRRQELAESAAAAEEHAAAAQRALERQPFSRWPAAELRPRVEKEAARAARWQRRGEGHGLWALWGVLLAGAGVLLYFLPWFYGAALGAAAIGLLIGETLRYRRRRSALLRAAEILRPYAAASPAELLSLLDTYEQELAAARAAQEEAREKRRLAAEDLPPLPALLPATLAPGEDEDESIMGQERELAALREECARARGRLSALGDPLVLESRSASLEESIAQEQQAWEALTLALETLEAAEKELQSEFSPALAELTTEYFSRLTGGRYDEVQLDAQLRAAVRGAGEILPRESGALSQGTADQLYLALRLALCELVLPGEEPCPLILDDALLAFDDKRLKRAVALLQELGETRQILLFTCQHRERKALEKGEKKQTEE